MPEYPLMRPHDVAALINFDKNNPDWTYRQDDPSMANKQAEGVAYLSNLLGGEQRLALLADEVGMGKTFQALGVMHMLWQRESTARVLVMAPNRNICNHWRREYKSFRNSHCRVPGAAPGVKMSPVCTSLDQLCDEVEKGIAQVFLVTTHSLSNLGTEGADDLDAVKARAAGVHQRLRAALQGQFDLMVVDEAHYFRNVHGDSQRVAAGKAFFGEPSNPLAKAVLLMTATPSHKGMQDVRAILGYFKTLPKERNAEALMQQFALRRLRLLDAGHGRHVNKHHYRHEVALPARFGTRTDSELFFALYQKRLMRQHQGKKLGKKLLYGYLEGFESTGANRLGDAVAASQTVEKGKDYHTAPDSPLLSTMSAEFYQVFGRFPDHPKYDACVQTLCPENLLDAAQPRHEHKHLVFVRRIPSVRELTQRVNRAYDRQFIPMILKAWGLREEEPAAREWRQSDWSRGGFNEMTRAQTIRLRSGLVNQNDDNEGGGDDIQVSAQTEGEPQEDKLGSIVMNLFVVKRGDNPTKEDAERTDCSNVRLRFSRPEFAFSLFLEPAADYRCGSYSSYYKSELAGRKDLYATSARDRRWRQHQLVPEAAPLTEYIKQGCEALGTAWGLIYPLLDPREREQIEKWLTSSRAAVLENFANYLREGFLFASPVMVELYCWFTEYQRECWQQDAAGYQLRSAQQRYIDFVAFLERNNKIASSLMLRYFRDALHSFEKLCDKIADHDIDDYKTKWSKLTHLQNPAWYASGESKERERLILGFNSPFFPSVLVATSVFQEGVNLHLQCRQVHHYGIAWTPGDNEQRVGRIDRLFGCVNDELIRSGTTTLNINYPYLAGSFDEDQLGSFIQHKYHVETAMDRCVFGEFDRSIDTSLTAGEWKSYLRTPVEDNEHLADPYPATFPHP